jgi:hypothetical protein
MLPMYDFLHFIHQITGRKMFSNFQMTKLWVKFEENNATRVSTEGCEIVDDFIKAVKKELSPHFDSIATDQLSIILNG